MPTVSEPLFVPGIGSQGWVGPGCPIPQHSSSLEKPGTGRRLQDERRAGCLAFPSHQVPVHRSRRRLPASLAMYRPRTWAGPEDRGWGCAVPSTVLLLFAYLAYLALGTGVFWTLEGRAAQESSRSFQRDKWELLQNFTCLDRSALDSLIRDVVQAYKNGASLLSNTTGMGRWELLGSFFFSVSTITTIGYGNLSPNTMAARLFCIFFALVGIPLNLVVLNRLGHLMQQGVNYCSSRLGGTWQDPGKARWLAGSGALLSGLLLFLLLPPLLFSHMEGWSYMEGFYFAFITLSTVGFGDYVIGMNPSRRYPLWYKNVVSLWILFGMAWLALIIKLILSQLETPGRVCSCYHHSSKEDFKSQSWRLGPDREPEAHSPQQECYPEGPMGIIRHLEPSAQAAGCCKDS
ncbi:potassium channel subfamily K member 17 isoform X1 [Papio anubis]|uniref:Potassium two pore domain channel subfamily K member 17 n=1 Tax=Papio anubis TaxID=9555 RepID=A0A096NHZ5_PAPAN|nr:potassium channel subfamily K member 17 isoform X1 [Papio anubis]